MNLSRQAQCPPPYSPATTGVASLASPLIGSVTGTISNALGWNNPPPPATTIPQQTPGDAIREARIRNSNYSARERGVVVDNYDDNGNDRERNWFNENGLAQEAPPTDEGKSD
jgi:hypothetical protein